MKRSAVTRFSTMLPTAALILAFSVQAQTREWTRLFGEKLDDKGAGIAIDREGAVYVSGSIEIKAYGIHPRNNKDYLIKFDLSGNRIWAKHWESDGYTTAGRVAASPDGGVIVTGGFSGSLDGIKSTDNQSDVFLSKFDSDGNKKWTRGFGATNHDNCGGVAVDARGNIFLTGLSCGVIDDQKTSSLCDAYLIKYSKEGDRVWTRRFGSQFNGDQGRALALDGSGNIIVTGYTEEKGSMTGSLFLAKYDVDGNRIWSAQAGTEGMDGGGYGVAIDDKGNSYVTGATNKDLDGQKCGGWYDILLMKFDPMGTRMWTRLYGTDSLDIGYAVAVGPDGKIYVTGVSCGKLAGTKKGAPTSMFISTYDSSGNRIRTFVSSAQGASGSSALAFGPDQRLYVTGSLAGGIEKQKSAGRSDIFLMKFMPWSPAFDCTKASTVQEKIICGSQDLSALDVALDSLFTACKKTVPNPTEIIADQKAWLQKDRNIRVSSEALVASMNSRMELLRSKLDGYKKGGNGPKPK